MSLEPIGVSFPGVPGLMLFGNLNFGDAKRRSAARDELPLTPALSRAGRGRERAQEVNRQGAETRSGKCLWCTSRADLNCGRDLYHRPTRAPFHFVRHLSSEIAVRRAPRAGAAQVMPKCFAKNTSFYEVCKPTLYQAPPGH